MSGTAIDGYSGRPLWQKLGLKPGLRIRVENPPRDYAGLVGLDPAELDLVGPRAGFDLVHVFATQRSELDSAIERLSRRLSADGVLWVSWPKKSSKVISDISEDTIRLIALPRGLVDIKVCAVDSVWSGLKLVWRKEVRASKMHPTA
jgi:hypothetical protein